MTTLNNPPRGIYAEFMRRFSKNRLAAISSMFVFTLILSAILAPLIAPYDPMDINHRAALLPPGWDHWLGTDSLGRDVFTRMLYGARISLSVGFVAVGISTLIGLVLGAISGYYGGWTDSVIMRFVDIMLTFPSFFLILAVVAYLDPSIWNIMIVIGITSWMSVARLVRAEFLSLTARDYVQSARAVGVGDMKIIFRHILPNAMAPVLVTATLGVAAAILVESALSFLGIGVQPPTPSWGNILMDGKTNIQLAWWLSIFPGLAILITVLCYNLLGEGIRDAIDPRLK